MDIYDEINLEIDPFKVLKISRYSDDITVKEAYKLLKKSYSPDNVHILETAYKILKTEELRERYKLLESAPYESLEEIKFLNKKPKRLTTSDWLGLIKE